MNNIAGGGASAGAGTNEVMINILILSINYFKIRFRLYCIKYYSNNCT